MFNYEIKFLTCDESLHLKNGDFKSYKYETKKRAEESVYDLGKRNYCEHRGGHWRAPRPRQIRQLESKLRDRSVVFCVWTHDTLVTIVFSSGAIAYLTVKPQTLDVTQILFDSYCVGKLSGQAVVGAVLCKSHLLFTHADRVVTLITFGKTSSAIPCRITDRDPHLQSLELGGGARRAERRVSWCENSSGVRVLLWTAATVEPAPWSPIIEDLANLHLYQVNRQHVVLVAYHQLENETLCAELSSKSENMIHIVEQISSHKTGVSLNWLRYEVPQDDRVTKLSSLREIATHVSLPAPARAVRRAPCDSRLVAACIDGSLHVVHRTAGVVHSVRAGFISTDVRWVGELVLAAEEGGRLQCFDRALSLLNHHIKCLDLSSFLKEGRRMQLLANRSTSRGQLVLTSFSGGPLALLNITHPRILSGWIRAGRTCNALSLLRALDWETEGTEGLWAVNKLVCAALRDPIHGSVGESTAQAALGSYLAPAAAHGPQAQRFAPPVHDLARKFFHHLLRRGRLEKAMSLAVDLSDWDLFCDARWAAARLSQPALAEEAASLAEHYAQQQESDSCDTCSQCSSHTCSASEGETSASSEHVRTKPPPLPRVPIPQNPNMMPVPISPAEPPSTNSIRPNLHQYLDRDNTIWNTAVRDDTHIRTSYNDLKPILNTQNNKWHSMDNVLNYNQGSKPTLLSISEGPSKPNHAIMEVKPRSHEMSHFRHLFQTDLRDDLPNTLYRYQNSNSYLPSTSMNDRAYRLENDIVERPRTGEKNKVKFSDTVTVAVVPESTSSGCPEPARELADSLPLCPPHKYLAAFAPHPPAGTTLDYVEV